MKKPLFITLVSVLSLGLVGGLTGLAVSASRKAHEFEPPVTSLIASSDDGVVMTIDKTELNLAPKELNVLPTGSLYCFLAGLDDNTVVWKSSDETKLKLSAAQTDGRTSIGLVPLYAYRGTVIVSAISLANPDLIKTCSVTFTNTMNYIASRYLGLVDGANVSNYVYKGGTAFTNDNIILPAMPTALDDNKLTKDKVACLTAKNVVTVTANTSVAFCIGFQVNYDIADSYDESFADLMTAVRDPSSTATATVTPFLSQNFGNFRTFDFKFDLTKGFTPGNYVFNLSGYFYCLKLVTK